MTATNYLPPGTILTSTARDEAGNSITFSYKAMTGTESAKARQRIAEAAGQVQVQREADFLKDRLTKWDVQTGDGQTAPFTREAFDKLPPELFHELVAQIQACATL